MKNLTIIIYFIVLFGCCNEKHFAKTKETEVVLKDNHSIESSMSYSDMIENDTICAETTENSSNSSIKNDTSYSYMYAYIIIFFLFLSIILYKTIRKYKLSSWVYFIFISMLCFMNS